MIRTVFTLANNIAKRFRYSPTAVIEGREQNHLQQIVESSQQQRVQRLAQQEHYKALLANTQCPFEREKIRIYAEYADKRVNLNFEDAWHKIDEVEQRQSDKIWRDFYEAKNAKI